jgi:hypothetical protein
MIFISGNLTDATDPSARIELDIRDINNKRFFHGLQLRGDLLSSSSSVGGVEARGRNSVVCRSEVFSCIAVTAEGAAKFLRNEFG